MACKQFLMNEGLIVEKLSAAERKALKSQLSSGCDKLWAEPVKKTLLCVIRLESAFVFGAKQANLMHSFICDVPLYIHYLYM